MKKVLLAIKYLFNFYNTIFILLKLKVYIHLTIRLIPYCRVHRFCVDASSEIKDFRTFEYSLQGFRGDKSHFCGLNFLYSVTHPTIFDVCSFLIYLRYY